jgi:predicted metalloprotease with PDZ domain
MKGGVETVSFGAGGASRNWASRMSSFEIAGSTLRNVIARYAEDKRGSFSSRTEAGNIGTEILANFTLEFDYARGEIWFEPIPGFEPSPFPRAGVGVNKTKPEAFVVVNVLRDGPGDAAGLRAGDEITTIDGVAAARLSFTDTRRVFSRPAGTNVALTYVRDGQEHDAMLVLRNVLP